MAGLGALKCELHRPSLSFVDREGMPPRDLEPSSGSVPKDVSDEYTRTGVVCGPALGR